jgi:hypothetical protein
MAFAATAWMQARADAEIVELAVREPAQFVRERTGGGIIRLRVCRNRRVPEPVFKFVNLELLPGRPLLRCLPPREIFWYSIKLDSGFGIVLESGLKVASVPLE